jgi:hypothetical protein
MINQYLTPEITSIIITVVLIPFIKQLLTITTTYLISKIDTMQHNIKSEKLNHYIDQAEDAVFTAVDSVSQTYVNSLKKSGSFDVEAQTKAFQEAKSKVLSMIGQEAKETLTEVYGDLDAWINNKIENYVKNSKECKISN